MKKKLFLSLLVSVALLAQTDVKAVFSGTRQHVPSAVPITTPFQPSDKAAPHLVLDPKDYAAVAARVDVTLRKFATWGLNPKGLTLDNYQVEFVVVKGQMVGGVGVHDRTYLRLTCIPPPPLKPQSGDYDVELIAKYGGYPVAADALKLCDKAPD